MNRIGIDIGGTKIALAKYDQDGQLLTENIIPTNSSGNQEAFLKDLVELLAEHLEEDTEAIGIGVPGPTKNGYVSKLPNIPNVQNLCLADELKKRLSSIDQRPVTISNDANCFIVGAWQKGKYKNKKNILGLTLGTGVGGGLIINGQLITGKDGVAGEFGHMIIRDGISLQDLCSGKALQKRWEKEYAEHKNGAEIVALAQKKDENTLKFLKKVGEDLGRAIGNLIMAFNPDVILIGGSAVAALPFMKESIQEVFQNLRYPQAANIDLVQLQGTDFATFGAAWLAKKMA